MEEASWHHVVSSSAAVAQAGLSPARLGGTVSSSARRPCGATTGLGAPEPRCPPSVQGPRRRVRGPPPFELGERLGDAWLRPPRRPTRERRARLLGPTGRTRWGSRGRPGGALGRRAKGLRVAHGKAARAAASPSAPARPAAHSACEGAEGSRRAPGRAFRARPASLGSLPVAPRRAAYEVQLGSEG